MICDLVFEGGGAKGMAFIGALDTLCSGGHTFGRLVGTSAGAITATLLACGLTPAEMRKASTEMVKSDDGRMVPIMATFMDFYGTDELVGVNHKDTLAYSMLRSIDVPYIPGWLEEVFAQTICIKLQGLSLYRQAYALLHYGGLCRGSKFSDWILKTIQGKYSWITSKTTMQEFHDSVGAHLTLMASDITSHGLLELNHEHTPDVPLVSAVRMSMSIPFVWTPIEWQRHWGLYSGHDIDGHFIVDGGVLSNFPLDNILRYDNGHEKIGLLIDEDIPVKAAPVPNGFMQKIGDVAQKIPVVKILDRLMNTLLLARDKVIMDKHEKNICRIPAGGYSSIEFDMSGTRTAALISSGAIAMENFLGQKK
jgi:NTE family protein